jgi:hypothetical protein
MNELRKVNSTFNAESAQYYAELKSLESLLFQVEKCPGFPRSLRFACQNPRSIEKVRVQQCATFYQLIVSKRWGIEQRQCFLIDALDFGVYGV